MHSDLCGDGDGPRKQGDDDQQQRARDGHGHSQEVRRQRVGTDPGRDPAGGTHRVHTVHGHVRRPLHGATNPRGQDRVRSQGAAGRPGASRDALGEDAGAYRATHAGVWHRHGLSEERGAYRSGTAAAAGDADRSEVPGFQSDAG
uniref:Uncharacterized protein n=1 Tax=Chaetoceros debilis TaxID=122233 RepID=A0A7S3VF00_9STRA|mmetsp:Transcript_2128/g.3131  ORF Transcript_2128/g.3131 Transcript_2128/m.3131 type:complete len:145 (-) Transcript_2128:218-652(-)